MDEQHRAAEGRRTEGTGGDWDAIVIGSGIGGLTAATLLATLRGKRVLVLERHFTLGGFTHTFRRGPFRWDVGLHYVGGMEPGSDGRGLMDLVTGGSVDWQRMPHDFDIFHYPGLDVAVPSDRKEYAARLAEAFPADAAALPAYFRDIERVGGWLGRETYRWSAPGALRAALWALGARDRRMALSTTGDQLRSRFGDPRLRAVLASQWGDHGLPPGRSAFAVHGLIAAHYLDGAWYPVGSAASIAEGARRVIEDHGGECRINHRVEEILVEDGRAVGVRTRVKKGRGGHEEVLRAPLVISDAGAVTTTRLLPRDAAPRLRAGVAAATPSAASITLHLGLSRDPAELGLTGANHWHFAGWDHDAAADGWRSALRGSPGLAYLSFPSMKDPRASSHTAEIITLGTAEPFRAWADRPWRRRGADYLELKSTIAAGLLDLVERTHPGLRELVVHEELSTPLSTEGFTGHPGGAVYGIAPTPDRLRDPRINARTDLPGLVLAGADACSLGVMGALMGGAFAAATTMGARGFPEIMSAAKRSAAAA